MLEAKLDLKKVRTSFNHAASTYDHHAIVQHEIADRLLERLHGIRLQPEVILDGGARSGYISQKLAALYPQAKLLSLDFSEKLLQQGVQYRHLVHPVCGDAMQIPIASQSVDLIIAHLVLPWVVDYQHCFLEWQRLMKPNGLLLFTSMGPDTLGELHASFVHAGSQGHVHQFVDMHLLGDALLTQGWMDPVVDNEMITVNYREVMQLLRDLKGTGVTNACQQRLRGLMGKNHLKKMLGYYELFASEQRRFPATYEVIYGHAWHNPTQTRHHSQHGQNDHEFVVPVRSVKSPKGPR